MTRINLLPAHRKQWSQSRKRLRLWLGILPAYGVLLAGACVAARMAWADGGGTNEQQLQASRNRIRQAETSLAVVRKQLTSLHTRQRIVTTLIDQPDWADFLRLLGVCMGPDLVLRDLSIRQVATAPVGPSPQPMLKGAPGRMYRLEMRGLAKTQADVSQCVVALENTKLFDEVRLLRTGREPFLTGSATSFELQCNFHDEGGH